MATVRIVRKNTKDDPVLLLMKLRYQCGGQHVQFTYSTGKFVPANCWDSKRAQCESRGGFHAAPINKYCRILSDHLQSFFDNYCFENMKPPSRGVLKKAMDSFSGKTGQPVRGIASFIKTYIIESENTGSSTRKNYRTFVKYWDMYTRSRGVTAEWEDIDYELLIDFRKFLSMQKSEYYPYGKLSGAYINKFLAQLQAVCRMAGEGKMMLHSSQKFSVPVKLKLKKKDHVILSEEDLGKLCSAVIKDKKLSDIRYLFLRGCYSGVRYSDLRHVTEKNIHVINGVEILKIHGSKKTDVQSAIPVHPNLKEAINKSSGVYLLSNKNFNKHLKRLAKLMKFERHDEFSSHVMRRTCVSILISKGFSDEQIMGAVGLKTKSMVSVYNHLRPEQKALSMTTNPFFSS